MRGSFAHASGTEASVFAEGTRVTKLEKKIGLNSIVSI